METKNKHNQVYADQNGNSRFAIVSLLPVGKENTVLTAGDKGVSMNEK